MIRLRSLGAVDLRSSTGSELRAVLAQPRRFALLARLALTGARGPQRRDQLLPLFWRDQDQNRARAALNRAIYFLRQALGEDVLQSRRDEIDLDLTRLSCDALEFDQAIDAKQYQEALDLYRGDLLPGFFVSDAPGFEEWLETERTRLRERASNAAWALADREEKAGNFDRAAQLARRAVELAPFREVGLRRLLALCDRAGDRGGAAYAYDRFVHAMAVELDVAPSPETKALIDAIRSRARPRDSTPAMELDQSHAVSAGPGGRDAPVNGGAVDSAPSLPRSGRRALLGTMAGVGMGVALISALVTSLPDPTPDPERVDVVPFANQTGDPTYDSLSTAITARVISALRQAGQFKVVAPVSRTANGWWHLDWARLIGRGRRSAQDRGAVSVSGELTRAHGELVLDARLTDAQRHGPVWFLSRIPVRLGGLERATRDLLQRVIGGVAALRNPYTARFLPAATPPPTFEAYQEYFEGVTQSRQRQYAEAQRHFRLAMVHDSSFTWPMIEAALTGLNWFAPTPPGQVDSILEDLNRIRGRIPVLQRHLLDYMLAVRVEDWGAAYRGMCDAARLAPLRFAYSCALGASHVNRPRATIEALTGNPEVESLHRKDAQNYWQVLTLAYHQLGEHRNELAAARRARENKPDSPSALAQEIKALAALGNVAAVQARLDTVVALGREGWFTPAQAMVEAAQELRAHGHPEAAEEIAARAIAWYRARPDEERTTEARRYALGLALYFHRDWADADSLFSGLAAEFPDNEEYPGYLGVIAARRGDRQTAEALAARLAAVERQLPVPGQTSTVWRAKIAALLGDRETAVSLLRDAFGPYGTMQLHRDVDAEPLRDYPPFREFIMPKG